LLRRVEYGEARVRPSRSGRWETGSRSMRMATSGQRLITRSYSSSIRVLSLYTHTHTHAHAHAHAHTHTHTHIHMYKMHVYIYIHIYTYIYIHIYIYIYIYIYIIFTCWYSSSGLTCTQGRAACPPPTHTIIIIIDIWSPARTHPPSRAAFPLSLARRGRDIHAQLYIYI